MSQTAELTFSVTVVRAGSEVEEGSSIGYFLPNSPFLSETIALNAGQTTIDIPDVPTQARYVRIVPPASSTVTKAIYLTDVGTNGWQIDPILETWLSIPMFYTIADPQLVIVASAPEAVQFYWF